MICYYKYLPYCGGETLIFWATVEGHTEIVKILAPLTDNPNAPTNSGNTPINRFEQYMLCCHLTKSSTHRPKC